MNGLKTKTPARLAALCLVCCLALGLGGCGTSKTPAQNTLAPMPLTADQQDLLTLLNTNQEISLLQYSVEEGYTWLELWVEQYAKGVPVGGTPLGGFGLTINGGPAQGRIAVICASHQDDDEADSYSFTLIADYDGGKTSTQSAPVVIPSSPDTGLASAYGPIDEAVAITPEGEILLYSWVFSLSGSMRSYSGQQFLQDPTLLAEYDHAFLVKCRFSQNPGTMG